MTLHTNPVGGGSSRAAKDLIMKIMGKKHKKHEKEEKKRKGRKHEKNNY